MRMRRRFRVVLTASMLWIVTGISLAAEAMAPGKPIIDTSEFANLPDVAQLVNYDTTAKSGANWVFAPIKDVPKQLINAVVAAEDRAFFKRSGPAIKLKLETIHQIAKCINSASGQNHSTEAEISATTQCVYAAAASDKDILLLFGRQTPETTIPAQLAGNILVTNARNLSRKLKEALLSERIEETYSKNIVMEIYLNRTYLGHASYGVAASARNYFNKSLNELQLNEMAYIAAAFKNPHLMNPIRNADKAIERRNWVLARMAEDGYITAKEADEAKARPLGYNPPPAAGK